MWLNSLFLALFVVGLVSLIKFLILFHFGDSGQLSCVICLRQCWRDPSGTLSIS